ncbi:BES1/BZR1-like protein 4-like [Hibiscus syriacus]|uniref:BES1/BZR1-like protein 4-like n=1 Tax=Hibiscus syriacus TaxID=106335 RepID=A0A6A3B748_HIBSY|nr:BES1/BZR1-like protein 4-like [Hibiscus syriacus]
MRYSFSCKNKWGTRITPMVQWPDKSFTLGLSQALAWKQTGLMMSPSIQFSLFPTFGGSNPGLQTEVVHTMKEDLNLICGCALAAHPSAFASISFGHSKWNGNVGKSGIVVRVDTPLSNVGSPSFSVQINNVIESKIWLLNLLPVPEMKHTMVLGHLQIMFHLWSTVASVQFAYTIDSPSPWFHG